MATKEEKKQYLQEKVNPIIERLIVDILAETPEDVIGFMKNWLDAKSGNPSPKLKEPQAKEDDLSASEDEEEDEEHTELPTKEEIIAKNQARSTRASVSAEVYGKFNQKSAFEAKVVAKSEEQKSRIRQKLSQAFMFSALDDKEQEIVINAMEEKTYQPEEYVINQGENGDLLYVVDSGKLACYKLFSGNAEPTFLKNYEPGESFGELALLYNAPRAASIKAVEPSVLFALDRETFNHIVKDAAMRKREEYENFLTNLELLSNVDAYERSKIADAVKRVKVPAGEYIVKEGEKGDVFYFVEEGEAYATKTVTQGEAAKEVYQYTPGSYFGELALLKDVPRQASVIAKTDLKLVALDRMSFKRLLGPLEDILQRNMKNYETFAS
jgi:cAMP-dependent protein kinase regulator